MNEEQVSALLGRPLTSIEVANFALYINIATEALEELICTPIADVVETRIFDIREGYSTVFINIFRSISEVKIDGVVIDPSQYSLRQWDKRIAGWYNSLVFDSRFLTTKEIEVTAVWGFDEGGSS